MKDKAERAYGFFVAFSVHACLLIMLSITSVVLWKTPEKRVEPQVQHIEIGEQLEIPHEATMDGFPDPSEIPPVPETGEPVEEPSEEDVMKPDTEIPDSMILDPDEPPPADITKKPKQGLPGEPSKPIPDKKGVLKPAKENRGPDSEGGTKIFGNKIEGKTLFVLDLSGSMDENYLTATRLEILKAELINTIKTLTDKDDFDILVYSGSKPSWDYYCQALWGTLVQAIQANKDEAIAWIKGLKAEGSTPTFEALKYACNFYTPKLENFILITDGEPDQGTKDLILEEFPRIWKHFEDCDFVCISIGSGGLDFVKRLAATINGKYSVVK